MRYLIIANPISGKKKSTSLLNELVIPILKQKNIHYKSFFTEFPSHASRIVNQYNFNNKIIAIKERIIWKIIFKPGGTPLEFLCFIFR